MKLNILLLCNKPAEGSDANTIVDHIEAFETYSEHRIWIYSNLGRLSNKLDLNQFDVVIIHYSLFILSQTYLSTSAKKRLRAYQGMKIIFIQDEYRRINDMVDTLDYLGMDVLFTCFPESEFPNIYPLDKLPKLSKYNNLTGYVPQRLTEYTHQPLIKDRALHVGYRGRKLPYWYGALGCDKWKIVEEWHQQVSESSGLKTDISASETDRIYGERWIDFLSSSKATLGVESGTSVMDFTGDLERKVDAYQLLHPHASFEEVRQKYFLKQEDLYQLNQISPRCFEAIALKTALVLFEGEYSGILEPGRHYIVLKKDFSNISEVLAYLQDDAFLQHMVDTTYQEIALNAKYSYATFMDRVDTVIKHEFLERNKSHLSLGCNEVLIKKMVAHRSFSKKVLIKMRNIYQDLPFAVRLVIKSMFRLCRLPYQFIKQLLLLFSKLLQKNKKILNGTTV